MYHRMNYEEDGPYNLDSAYKVAGYPGIAWHLWGWETEPDEDTEWTGVEARTGKLVLSMVGDDRRFAIEPEDITPLSDSDYCHECGQIGCSH